ncbi:unnamed protein product [Clonostachys rosea f. rosea IK726]|uniref:Uncharacterized protein n=1 Tax=Clonostachys rosea f. rosea IK726 TaxID=1349383 RepID=A0ACA9UMR6_BIOOC|nr:unnamed protein product [Clonostachys rosea f. rosea IK726]
MSVDDVSKASGMCGGAWDPTKHWASRDCSFRLTATPQEGYCFPQYLEHAGSGTYQLGALYSRPYDLDAIICAPAAAPADRSITFSERHGKCSESPCLRSATRRKFSVQQIEQHWANMDTEDRYLERMVESVRRMLTRSSFGRHTTAVYIMTGFRIADGLEVSDGEFYRKFDGRVILSYQMHKVTVNRHGGLVVEVADPKAT